MTEPEYRQDDLRDTGFCPRCGQPLAAMTTGARGYCETHRWQYADWARPEYHAEGLDERGIYGGRANLTPGVMTGKENDR